MQHGSSDSDSISCLPIKNNLEAIHRDHMEKISCRAREENNEAREIITWSSHGITAFQPTTNIQPDDNVLKDFNSNQQSLTKCDDKACSLSLSLSLTEGGKGWVSHMAMSNKSQSIFLILQRIVIYASKW